MRMHTGNRLKVETKLRQKAALILLGLFLLVVALEAILRLSGLIFLSSQERRNLSSIRQKGSYRIMCVGESTTAGIYPELLEEILNRRGAGIRFAVINKGVPGVNTSRILERLEKELDTYNPDMVIAMMGLNDTGRHIPYAHTASPQSQSPFNSFRISKLIFLLREHAAEKIRELRFQDKTRDAERQDGERGKDILKEATALGASDEYSREALVQLYITRKSFSEAEALLKRSLELNPRNPSYYTDLGFIYSRNNRLEMAEPMFKKAIELDPRNETAYFDLGLYVYKTRGDLLQLEEVLRRAITLNPEFSWAYIELADCYRRQGRPGGAAEALKEAMKADPDNADRYYGALASLSVIADNRGEMGSYYEKAEELRFGHYNPVTRSNYLRLKEILDKRKIKIVCMQYPVRSIVPLKNIFRDQPGVIFVDNERIFKEALAERGYEEYFRDMIGGDFGHCTERGNMLLAGNAADVILKEVFGR